MKRRRRLLAHPGFLALLFAFGLFLFYWPFLLHRQEWRQPHTTVYFFVAWAFLIVMVFLVSRNLRPRGGRDDDPSSRPPSFGE